MIPLDHVLAAIFSIGFSLVSIPLYARRRPGLLAGDSGTKRREYPETIAWLASNGAAGMRVLATREPDPA